MWICLIIIVLAVATIQQGENWISKTPQVVTLIVVIYLILVMYQQINMLESSSSSSSSSRITVIVIRQVLAVVVLPELQTKRKNYNQSNNSNYLDKLRERLRISLVSYFYWINNKYMYLIIYNQLIKFFSHTTRKWWRSKDKELYLTMHLVIKFN